MKLEEFVAHTSNVNCLKIGKKSSRVLVTGGEDHKVNMWAIGKPNAILSLSGHSSAVECVNFDSAEVLVVAGAASGTIKLWDLEEAKIVRTLTGHRSNCICVDFHPFGEFFASGSLDTNLKIWDIRRKGCIHTYKGHTRGVNSIKFSPDGRWVVSGGEDNIVKLWDLTAGKLMHDFKCHEGQIQCMDFHPHEFLLATGSADRTAKFWDLETFELIGSTGPEVTGVRSMIFNPDGRTLLCGLHESLKVFSWEPLRCHDAVDVGWSKLADLNIHEGKLLGCSYNQSCVGVWVVDILQAGPYAVGSASRTNGLIVGKLNSSGNRTVQQLDNSMRSNVARLTVPQSLESGIKEMKSAPLSTTAESVPSTPQRASMNFPSKCFPASSALSSYMLTPKSSVSRVQPTSSFHSPGRFDVVPVVVPRNSIRVEAIADTKREINNVGRMVPCNVASKPVDVMKAGSSRVDLEGADSSGQCESMSEKLRVCNDQTDQNVVCRPDKASISSTAVPEGNRAGIRWIGSAKFKRNSLVESAGSPRDGSTIFPWAAPDDGSVLQPGWQIMEAASAGGVEPGHAHALVASWERRERAVTIDSPAMINACSTMIPGLDRGSNRSSERDGTAADENDAMEDLIQQHNAFANILLSRLSRLQVIRRFWEKNDVKGAIEAMGKMGDHSVLTDVISVLTKKSEVLTLDICTVMLPLLTGLLGSELERQLSVALEMLLVLVRSFGHVIHTTISASPAVGVDLHAEQRLERCNLCYIELEKIKQIIVPIIRRGGIVANLGQELSVQLQEV